MNGIGGLIMSVLEFVFRKIIMKYFLEIILFICAFSGGLYGVIYVENKTVSPVEATVDSLRIIITNLDSSLNALIDTVQAHEDSVHRSIGVLHTKIDSITNISNKSQCSDIEHLRTRIRLLQNKTGDLVKLWMGCECMLQK